MPGGITDIGQNWTLDQLFMSGIPASWFIGLLLVEPTERTTEANAVEVSGGGYERILVPNDALHWMESQNGTKENSQAIPWGEATTNWGTVVSAGLYTAATGGLLIAWARLNIGRHVYVGAKVFFAPRMLTFSLASSRQAD